jgi:hypothetical protein
MSIQLYCHWTLRQVLEDDIELHYGMDKHSKGRYRLIVKYIQI